jgi:thioredoxin 1
MRYCVAIGKVSDADFEAQVLKAQGPVVVDFRAEWCGPCRMIAPALDEISGAMGNKLRIVKLNVDESPKTAFEVRRDVVPDPDDVQGRRNGFAPCWRCAQGKTAAMDHRCALIDQASHLSRRLSMTRVSRGPAKL